MVLSETRRGAGLTLRRVLRGGLALDEDLGSSVCRANVLEETHPRTLSGILVRRGNELPAVFYAPGSGLFDCTLSIAGL